MNKFQHLEAIRGLTSILVVIAHFACAFFPFTLFAYVTPGEYAPHSAVEQLFYKTPLAIFVSGNYALSLFLIISGYVLSHKLIGQKNVRIRVLGSALKRPVRLLGLIWFSMIVAYIFWRLGWFYNHEAAPLTSSIPWLDAYWGRVPNIGRFLRDLFTSPFSSGETYNALLWMMEIEVHLSMLTFAYVFFFGDRRYRLLALILIIFLLWGNLQSGFIVGMPLGILCAEIELYLRNKDIRLPEPLLFTMLAIGFFLGTYPPFIPASVTKNTIYGFLPLMNSTSGYPMIGGVLTFFVIIMSRRLHKILDKKWLSKLGHIGYSVFAIHLILMGSFSSALYLFLYNRLGHNGAALVSLGATFPLVIGLAIIITRLVDENFSKLANALSAYSQKVMNGWLERWRQRTKPIEANADTNK